MVIACAGDGHLGAAQLSRLMLTVPIGLPSVPRYSRTTTTPRSMRGLKSGFLQLPSFTTGVNFVSNVALLIPSDSGLMSVYVVVSFRPGPAFAPSNLVFASTAAGAAWLA